MRVRVAIILGLFFASALAQAQAPGAPAGTPEATPPAPPADATEPVPSAAPDTIAPVESAPPEAAAMDGSAGVEGMSEAELLELGFGGGSEAPAVDTSLKLSGFVDLGMNVGLNDFTKQVIGEHPAFFIGNLNLYLNKNITDTVRTMIEVRLLYLPHGSGGAFGGTPTNASAQDYADFNRDLHWGGIEMERVYAEWDAHRYLTIRGGQFLTPYGVWNVDHGSPTIIPAQKPYIIGVGFFPERQLGLELYGRVDVSNNGTLGYHLTLSNGTGPYTEYRDLDRNKAVGVRAYFDYRKLGEFRLGGSGYYGRNTASTTTAGLVNGTFGLITKIDTQSDVLALGLDAVWKYRGLHLQAEFVSEQREYTEKGRTVAVNMFTMTSAYPADTFSWGTYGVLGYRFEFFGIMPFVMAQYMDQPSGLGKIAAAHFGLNVRPIDALALKIQYDLVNFPDRAPGFGDEGVRALYTQVAWAF